MMRGNENEVKRVYLLKDAIGYLVAWDGPTRAALVVCETAKRANHTRFLAQGNGWKAKAVDFTKAQAIAREIGACGLHVLGEMDGDVRFVPLVK